MKRPPLTSVEYTRPLLAVLAVLLGAPRNAAAQPPVGHWTVESSAIPTPGKPILSRERTSARLSDTVTMRITDVNPFRYALRIRIDAKVVTEPALAAFVSATYGFVVPADLKAALALASGGAVDPKAIPEATKAQLYSLGVRDSAPIVAKCETDRLKLVTAQERYNEALLHLRHRTSEIHLRGNALTGLDALLSAGHRTLLDETARAEQLRDAANRIVHETASFFAHEDTTNRASQIDKVTRELERLRDSIPVWRAVAPVCTKELVAAYDTLTLAVRASLWSAYDLAATSAKLPALYAQLAKSAKDISSMLTGPDRFSVSLDIGPFAQPTDVTVFVERRDAGSTGEWKELDRLTINFGGPRRFTLGFGSLWSGIVNRTFSVSTAQRAPVNTGTGDTLVTTVALTNESRGRINPMVTLDAVFPRRVHAITGVSYRVAGSWPHSHSDCSFFSLSAFSTENKR